MCWHILLTSTLALCVWSLLLAGVWIIDAQPTRIQEVPLDGLWRTFYLAHDSERLVRESQHKLKRAKMRNCTLEVAVNGYGAESNFPGALSKLALKDDRDLINQYYKNLADGNSPVAGVSDDGETEYEHYYEKVEVTCQGIDPRTGFYTPIRPEQVLELMNEVYSFPASECAAIRLQTAIRHAEISARYVCPKVKVRNVLPPLGVLLPALARKQRYKPSKPPNIPSTSQVLNMWTIQASKSNCTIHVELQNFQTGRGAIFETYVGADIPIWENSQFPRTLKARDYTGQTLQFASCNDQVFIASMNSMYSPYHGYWLFDSEYLSPPLPTFRNMTYWEECHSKNSPALAAVHSRCNPTIALHAETEKKSFDFVVQNLDQVRRTTTTITRPSAEYEIELSFANLGGQMFFGLFMGADDWYGSPQRDVRRTWIEGVGQATEGSGIVIDMDQVKITTDVMLTKPGQAAYSVFYRAVKKDSKALNSSAISRVVPSKVLVAQNESQQYQFVVPQEFSYDALDRGIKGLEYDPMVDNRLPIGGVLPVWTSVLQIPVTPAHAKCKAVVEFQNLDITIFYEDYLRLQLLRVTLDTDNPALKQSYAELATNARKCIVPGAGQILNSAMLNCAVLGIKYLSTAQDGSLLISFAAQLPPKPSYQPWQDSAAWGLGWNMTHRQICP